MNYDEVIKSLMVLGAVPLNSEDSNFQAIVPAMFHYADGRIYRDLNFLLTDVTSVIVLPARQREVVLPDNVITVRSLSVCTPVGAVTENSRRHPLERISPESLDMFWPQGSFKVGLPRKYAIAASHTPSAATPNPLPPGTQPLPPVVVPERFFYTVRLMPSPDRAYSAELYGGIEPEILSERNPETLLSVRYAELFLAACMVYLAGYQRDYGAGSDDPTRAMSWETQYRALRDGVALEARARRSEGPGTATQARVA